MNRLPDITPDYIDFIRKNKSEDLSSLLLKYHGKPSSFDVDSALLQIKCRRKTSKKLKSFLEKEQFLFPSALSAEQASHQAVAQYHSSLIPDNSTLLDMTAGLGIDVMTMAGKCSKATAVEIETLKAEALNHNCIVMGIGNIEVINADSVKWLQENENHFDVIFIDPARRDNDNKRTYNFHDCAPDIISIQQMLRNRARQVFIKASPLLDLTQTLRDISEVRSIRAICVEGECKEILVETSNEAAGDHTPSISTTTILKEAIDLDNDGNIISIFSCIEAEPSSSDNINNIVYAEESDVKPGYYLYEPNAAVMKLAPWNELCRKYPDLKKLAPSSHLFISTILHDDFPGRILSIEKLIEKKDRKNLKGLPVNVSVRNYPLSAENLRKQLGTKEGRDMFIYGTRIKNPVLILARRFQIH
ncbi:MAG: hypothetical protein HDS35_07370 [Bacteroides sp.]|nr:hypothetical protein [Bacteroides sp.]